MKSVHLENFPKQIFDPEEELVKQMDTVREICSAVLSLRKKFNLRARLPLSKLTVIGENALIFEKFKKFIMDEGNVKKIIFNPNFTTETKMKLDISFDKVGKKFGKKMPEILKSVKAGTWKKLANGSILAGQEILTAEDFTLKLVPSFDGENYESVGSELLVVLDIEITEALEMEGLARDFVRIVQNERKFKGLEVNDKISLLYEGDEKFEGMVNQNIAYIKEQCLIEKCLKSAEDKSFSPVNLEGVTAMMRIDVISK
jgi:isoleucyl-tRNA synthetase